MDEKRIEQRKRSFLKGRIVFNNGASTFDCVIRDVSARGARLELSQSTALPDVFDLEIPHRGETLPARLRWMRGAQVGVNFSTPAVAAEVDALASARRARELDRENERLRRVIADLQAELAAFTPRRAS